MPRQWKVSRHVEWLCKERVQPLIDGQIRRLALSMPPQHVKSSTVTHRLAVYWGLNHPGTTILQTGYSQTFAEKELSYPTREVARSLGLLDKGDNALEAWRFRNGSRLVSRGVGNPPTGVPRIGLLLMDDPVSSRQQADSAVERENIWRWYTGSIVQRFWPDTRAVLINTRWHHDDVYGRLKERDDGSWVFTNLAAIAEDGDPMGRAAGEALWPEEKPAAFLHAQRAEMGDYDFEALFQGNPTPREGAMFQPDKVTVVSALHVPGQPDVMSVDVAASVKAGDWTTAVFLWRLTGGHMLIEAHRTRLEPFARNKWLRGLADKRRPKKVTFPRDPGAAGKEALQNFVGLMQGHWVVGCPPTTSKEARAHPAASACNAGLFMLVENAFSRDFLDELRQFPLGKHDDWVDALSDGYEALARPVFAAASG